MVHVPRYPYIVAWFFFIWIFSKRVERCEEDSLSSFLGFFASCNESSFKDRLDVERTSSVKDKFFSIVWNFDVIHQFRCNHVSTSVSLSCTTRTLSCYYLHTSIKSNPFLNIVVLLGLQALSVVLEIYCSNELLRQGLVHIDHSGVPICWIGRNALPHPFLHGYVSFREVRWIRSPD